MLHQSIIALTLNDRKGIKSPKSACIKGVVSHGPDAGHKSIKWSV